MMNLLIRKTIVFLVLAFCLPPLMTAAKAGDETGWSKETKMMMTVASGAAAISAWGVANWDYFSASPHTENEGWFSSSTKSGGMDKLGHLYSAYTLSHLLTWVYKDFGYSQKQGAVLGAASSLGLTTFMELGDAISDLGFSYEDIIMNLVGCAAGYFTATHPDIREKFDFRIEYRPDFEESDSITDYENQKFLIALKLDGFKGTEQSCLKYFELHLGYYARGFEGRSDLEQNVYIGFGLNLSRVFRQKDMPRVSKTFNYIQVPYTYLELP